MEIILAKTAGFCFGVRRAMDKVNEQIEGSDGTRKIYTYGPIIHNNEVVNDLKNRGVDVINTPEEISGIKGQTMIIRSHGVPREIYEKAEAQDVKIVDATCPFVKKIHKIVEERSMAGDEILIIGDRSHPEVVGIVGWCCSAPTVVRSEEEAIAYRPAGENSHITIVSQTTFNLQKFKHLVEIINKKGYDTNVINTICSATAERQREAADISVRADRMLVIGDAQSSNTRKLVEICKLNCDGTYHIQTAKDLPQVGFRTNECVGITAGASTPNYLIQEVLLYVRGNSFQ